MPWAGSISKVEAVEFPPELSCEPFRLRKRGSSDRVNPVIDNEVSQAASLYLM